MAMVIRIGTRASQLALAQTQLIIDRIVAHYPDITVELVKIKTQGDSVIDRPLSTIGGKGLFVKEIEEALQKGDIDVAVHSLKDVPAELPDSLYIGIIPEREDPHDVMIARDNVSVNDLPEGSTIGTSSLRRAAQLLHYRSDFTIVPLRGNLDTRIKKLDTSGIQAIVVAGAGLHRLGLRHRITQSFPFDFMLPAIGQGALGLEMRRGDQKAKDIVAFMDHYQTRVTVEAERSFLKELKGGCQVPVAGFAQLKDGNLVLDGLVANLDGSMIIRDRITGALENAQDMGTSLAQRLLDAGARKILDEIMLNLLSS